MYNKNSILYNIPEEQIATHSLEAKGKNIWLICIFLKLNISKGKENAESLWVTVTKTIQSLLCSEISDSPLLMPNSYSLSGE